VKPLPVPGTFSALFYFLVVSAAVGLRLAVKRYRLFPTVLVLCLGMQFAAIVLVPATVLIIRWRSPKVEERPFQRDPLPLQWLPSRYSVASVCALCALMWLIAYSLDDLDIWHAGAMMQCLSFVILGIKAAVARNMTSLSTRKVELDVVWLSARLVATLLIDKRLPRRTASSLFIAADGLSLVVAFGLLVFLRRFSRSSQMESDCFPSRYLMLAAIIAAAIVRLDISHQYAKDVLWTFGAYLDAVSMVPQLWIIAQSGGVVDESVGHHMAAYFISRLMQVIFWWAIRGTWMGGMGFTGWVILVVFVAKLILLSSFMCFYFKACITHGILSGVPVVCAEH